MKYKTVSMQFYKLANQFILKNVLKKWGFKGAVEAPKKNQIDAERALLLSEDPAFLHKKYRVSVILPTYNRGKVLLDAINSVLSQTFENFELIVSDDGSTDDTPEVMATITDSRVRYIRAENSGVSGARNRAIDLASGNILAFLDSDNVWTKEHLYLSLAKIEKYNLDAVYGILEMIDGQSKNMGWRAREFDFPKLCERNYIDLNVFVMRVDPQYPLRFDEQIRRAVDWDFILRATRGKRVSLGYFISAKYLHDEREVSRLTNSEYTLYTKIVRARNLYYPVAAYDREGVIKLAQLRVTIHICAPREEAVSWGDYYYALAVQKYLNVQGYVANLAYADTPSRMYKDTDINIAIVGRSLKKLPRNKLNIVWVISHPEFFTKELAAQFRIIFSASPYFTRYLLAESRLDVRLLEQASDTDYFNKKGRPDKASIPCVFVGSSKGVERPFIERLATALEDFRVIGRGWSKKIDPEKIISDWIDNAQLPELYRNSQVVLSEHWRSMRLFGIIANRVSDALSTGAHVVSDNLRVPSRYVPKNLTMCKSISEAAEAAKTVINGEVDCLLQGEVGVSFRQQVDVIGRAISDNIFSKGQNGPQSDIEVEILADLTDPRTEWLFVNVMLAHLHEEAVEAIQFSWTNHEANPSIIRIKGKELSSVIENADLESLLYEASIVLNDAFGCQTRSRVVLDEKIWRVFSVGRKPKRHPRFLTVISDDLETLRHRLPELERAFSEIRVWTPLLTQRAVVKDGRISIREFSDSTRSRIRHFLQDAGSYLGFVDVACPTVPILHSLVASGCHVIYDADLNPNIQLLLRQEDLEHTSLTLNSIGGWARAAKLELPDPRSKYWAKFGDPDYPTFEE